MIKLEVRYALTEKLYKEPVKVPEYNYQYPEYVTEYGTHTEEYTLEQAKAKVQKLQEQRFYVEMKDFWNAEDYRVSNALLNMVRRLEQAIKEEEANQ